MKTLSDLRLLLDDYAGINLSSSGMLEVGTDDYEVEQSRFASLTASEQEMYLWKPEIEQTAGGWNTIFSGLYVLNTVLEEMEYAVDKHQPLAAEIKGTALFWRSFNIFSGAQVFCLPYEAGGKNDGLGFPIKLSADFFEEGVVRGTVEQTYARILADMKEALTLLPEYMVYKSRPSKIAAHAALARIYLSMQDYEQAYFHADEALKRYNILIDFNTVDLTQNVPFSRDNSQVILHAASNGGVAGLIHGNRNTHVPRVLYDQYEEGDLRKIGFFFSRGNGNFSFKARYSLSLASQHFTGFATDELFLIRAECLARSGKTEEALADLNHLLRHRWVPDLFRPAVASNSEDALRLILTERRKELLMRGVRWSDLKRLNLDPRFEITLVRKVIVEGQEQVYTLPPRDLRYAYPIPQRAIDEMGLEQNRR